ncbi:hypothetical protein KP509_22G034300 [Ceratopteris richardii]|uniref:Uncharacterized protein n=1 Tax=Ceratopteris richardii TaxID=49495 RepID=A0A8T2S759_CERRI|nr:hypothetical protein KP509_22G034300 [Ceratopteris richardii]
MCCTHVFSCSCLYTIVLASTEMMSCLLWYLLPVFLSVSMFGFPIYACCSTFILLTVLCILQSNISCSSNLSNGVPLSLLSSSHPSIPSTSPLSTFVLLSIAFSAVFLMSPVSKYVDMAAHQLLVCRCTILHSGINFFRHDCKHAMHMGFKEGLQDGECP